MKRKFIYLCVHLHENSRKRKNTKKPKKMITQKRRGKNDKKTHIFKSEDAYVQEQRC